MDWIKVFELFSGLSLTGWACLIYGAFRKRWFRGKLERETEEAQAQIIRYTAKAVSNGRTTRKGYFPVLSFPANGSDREVQAREELDSAKFPEGTTVRVWFDPYEPSHLHLTEDDNGVGSGVMRFSWYFILGAAVLSLVIGFFAFRR